jgi:DNA repair exonuclease SbcCD ATPase subunit
MKALKSKLNDCNAKLVEKAAENSADKNTISELHESMSLLEKEKIQLNEKMNIFESSNKEQKQQLSVLYSKLNDCVKELIEKAAENITDKNVINDLRESILSNEKEKNQLNEEIMNLQSKNEKQQKLMKSLYLEGEAAKSKLSGMKKLEEECKTMAITIKNFVIIKKYLEDTSSNAFKTAEEAYQDSEKLQQAVEDLSNDKAQLEEKCVNALFEIEERKKYERILESTLQAADEKIHNLSQSEKALKDQSEKLRKRLNQSINDKKQSDEEKEQLCIIKNRLKRYNEEIEKNLKCQKDENAYLKSSLANHLQKISSLEANIEGLKAIVKEKENFLETNIKLTAELDSIKSIAADLETRNERQAGELKRFCKSNERMGALFKKSRIETDDPQNTVSASTEPCSNDLP